MEVSTISQWNVLLCVQNREAGGCAAGSRGMGLCSCFGYALEDMLIHEAQHIDVVHREVLHVLRVLMVQLQGFSRLLGCLASLVISSMKSPELL